MRVVFPTDPICEPLVASVFLAGSIEMGKAVDWQSCVTETFKDDKIVFFNPRRKDWDSSWKQVKTDPQFSQQVKWELRHLEKADIVALYLAPGTVSPISLLELGLYMGSGKLIICCPEGFERKGNVDITAESCGVKVWENFEDFVEEIRRKTSKINGLH